MDAAAIDAKMIARYEIAISKHARCWRKKQGRAAVHLLRYRLFYLLLASEGRHCFYEHEANIKDARVTPIHFADYDVSVQDGQSCVRLAPQTKQRLKEDFLGMACFPQTTSRRPSLRSTVHPGIRGQTLLRRPARMCARGNRSRTFLDGGAFGARARRARGSTFCTCLLGS